MSETTEHRSNYFMVFGILVAALAISLALAAVSTGPIVVAAIFAIATVKAYLVLTHFIHLNVEPRFIKVLVIGLLAVLTVLYIGLVPDIVWVFGRMEGA
ncbi:MAG: hypothetical protein CME06_07880 [Gemmatimonadetes bacterium]|nr:hypothetical protein [Gemmatimonadota bacterium]